MSRQPTPAACAFCPDPQPEAVCDWPEQQLVKVRPIVARVGDAIEVRRALWKITAIEQFANSFKLLAARDGLEISGSVPFNGWLKVQRIAPCGQACCFRHRRHVAENRDYCLSHWDSWRAA